MNERTCLKALNDLDTHIHYLAAKRACDKKQVGMSLEWWVKTYNTICRFVGSKEAKKLIEYTRD